MRQYENEVQKIKNEVLTLLAKSAFNDTLLDDLNRIPKAVDPGPEGRVRCCVHHERAITSERVQMALGGNGNIHEIVEVLPSACDRCVVNRFVVTEACRGCLANRCIGVCPKDAINIEKGRAVIDQSKCIECGLCKEVCPYSAIADVRRPCSRGCPVDAITVDENRCAAIDYKLCISCGVCVYNCPFGAIQEKSDIVHVIDLLKQKKANMYAVLAPSFATQFQYAALGSVITGIKMLGFKDVIEAALGADLVTKHEVEEFVALKSEEKVMTSSCCPGFYNLIEDKYPELMKYVSTTVSPMIATARLIHKIDPDGLVVFIGPCIAKKHEGMRTDDIEFVLTFEELAALLEAKGIDLNAVEISPLNNASYYGRRFAASGGVAKAITHHLQGSYPEFEHDKLQMIQCDGIDACDKTLKLLKAGRIQGAFIEGMACKGGCIKGPATMHHGPKDMKAVEAYSRKAYEEEVESSTKLFDAFEIDLTHK